MREIRDQFSAVFRTRSGIKFNGELGLPIERTTPSDFRSRRLLTVSNRALVTTGDVVSCDGRTYLLSFQNALTYTNQFRAFEITHRLSWTRMTEEIDLATGMPRGTVSMILDDALPVVLEYGKIAENLAIETDKYRVLTGSDVRVGDRLGAWIVQTRREAVGLNLLEIA